MALVDASERLDAYTTGLQVQRAAHNPAALHQRLADELADAATAGKALDTGPLAVEGVMDAQRRREALEALAHAAAMARGDLSARIEAAVFDERAVTEGLAPAFAELLAGVRSVAPALAGVDVTQPDSIIGAPAATAKAYRALEAASARLDVIKTAQRITTGHADDEGWFATFLDPRAVWGSEWSGRHVRTYRPWPEHPLAYLVWLATSEESAAGKPGIHTVAQREAAYAEYTEATRRFAQQQRALGALAG